MISEGTIVRGKNAGECLSGITIRTQSHCRSDVTATVAEVLFQVGTNERAIYVHVNNEFHLIRDSISRIAPNDLEIA